MNIGMTKYAIFGLLMTQVGCGDSVSQQEKMQEIETFIAQAKTRQQMEITPIPELHDYTLPIPEIKRNPFYTNINTQIIEATTDNVVAKNIDDSYNKYKLLSTHIKGANKTALLLSPDGSAYIMEVGSRFSKQGAKIINVTPGSVEYTVENKKLFLTLKGKIE